MQTPEDVQAMLKLASMGWGAKRIASEMGCSRNTVRRYVRQGGWQPYQPPLRPGKLSEHAQWLAERFRQHRGNCDVAPCADSPRYQDRAAALGAPLKSRIASERLLGPWVLCDILDAYGVPTQPEWDKKKAQQRESVLGL